MKLQPFLHIFKKKYIQIWNCMKIRLVGADLFHADGQTDMTKLIAAFPNFTFCLINQRCKTIKPTIRHMHYFRWSSVSVLHNPNLIAKHNLINICVGYIKNAWRHSCRFITMVNSRRLLRMTQSTAAVSFSGSFLRRTEHSYWWKWQPCLCGGHVTADVTPSGSLRVDGHNTFFSRKLRHETRVWAAIFK
jgi:hypothetical protein